MTWIQRSMEGVPIIRCGKWHCKCYSHLFTYLPKTYICFRQHFPSWDEYWYCLSMISKIPFWIISLYPYKTTVISSFVVQQNQIASSLFASYLFCYISLKLNYKVNFKNAIHFKDKFRFRYIMSNASIKRITPGRV